LEASVVPADVVARVCTGVASVGAMSTVGTSYTSMGTSGGTGVGVASSGVNSRVDLVCEVGLFQRLVMCFLLC
jgi:hypothetical protein